MASVTTGAVQPRSPLRMFQRSDRAVRGVRWPGAGQVDDRRGQVGRHDRVEATPGRHAGAGDEQRHAERRLVRQLLAHPLAVLAEEVAVVGREHQHRVVQLAGRPQGVDEPRHLEVEHEQRLGPLTGHPRLRLDLGVVERRHLHRAGLVGDVGLGLPRRREAGAAGDQGVRTTPHPRRPRRAGEPRLGAVVAPHVVDVVGLVRQAGVRCERGQVHEERLLARRLATTSRTIRPSSVVWYSPLVRPHGPVLVQHRVEVVVGAGAHGVRHLEQAVPVAPAGGHERRRRLAGHPRRHQAVVVEVLADERRPVPRLAAARWPRSRCRRSHRTRTAPRCRASGGCARTARSGTTPGRGSRAGTG